MKGADGVHLRRVVRRAILSIARKNGKTALIASLVLAHLVGPEAVMNGEIYSAANDREQAAQVFKVAKQFVEADHELSDLIRIIPSTKTLSCYSNGSFYRAVSADAGRKHGLNPTVAIFDELAQAKSRELYDVLDTSMGAREEPLYIIISTQSNDPRHILSELIDDALSGSDPSTLCHLYAVPENENIFDPSNWKLANPALGDFRSFEDLKMAADRAKRMPSEEPKFRNLFLNQRYSPVSSLISRAEWMECAGQADFVDGEEVYLALDLSAVVDLSALIMGSASPDRTKIRPFIWKPADLLIDHSDRDFGKGNLRYAIWAKEGHLLTSPGKSISPEVIAKKIAELCDKYKVRALAYDRWRISDLMREFDRIGLQAYKDSGEGVETKHFKAGLRVIPWGQGWKDMAPAIDALELEVINRTIIHPSNPVLNWAMSNAISTMDPAGNRKLDKEKVRFRIDPAVALTMLCGLKSRNKQDQFDMDEFLSSAVMR